MSKYTDAAVERFTSTGWAPLVRDLATELLAARRELAELRRERDRLDEENRAALPLLEMVRTRPLTCDDQWMERGDEDAVWRFHDFDRVETARDSMENAKYRVVLVPVPSAAPESAPNRFREGAQKLADEYASLGIPEHIINAPPQHDTATEMWLAESAPAEKAGEWKVSPWVGLPLPVVGDRVRMAHGKDPSIGVVEEVVAFGGRIVRWPRGDRFTYNVDDLAPAPPPEPVTFTAQGMALDEERAKSRPTEADFERAVEDAMDRFDEALDSVPTEPITPVDLTGYSVTAKVTNAAGGQIRVTVTPLEEPEPPAEGAGEKRHVPQQYTSAQIRAMFAQSDRTVHEKLDSIECALLRLFSLLGDGGGR